MIQRDNNGIIVIDNRNAVNNVKSRGRLEALDNKDICISTSPLLTGGVEIRLKGDNGNHITTLSLNNLQLAALKELLEVY